MKSPPSRSRRPHPIPSFHPPSGERGSESMASGGRVDLDGGAVPPLTICMIGTGGFIGSHLCEKLMAETPHVVLAVNVYSDKIRHLVDPPPPHLARHISFHHLNIKNDPRLKGLVKMADLVLPLPPSSRGSSHGAAAPAPTRRRPGDPRKSDQKTDPKPAGTSPEPIQEPRVEEARGCGGFAFLCALAGQQGGHYWNLYADEVRQALLWQCRRLCSRMGRQIWQGSWAIRSWHSPQTRYAQFTFEVMSLLIPALRVAVEFCCLFNWGLTLVA
ncbi:uncharacterized protein LOC123448618 isoform X2 [Hordeum vulgare subsp. vulgare]|uniref:uncharacterized protein LOC123448618 isoform X2 n=1 Tax=Hordeum vulgare subsp. vulgare TaxID=112509 RepID=UPI00162DBF4E|nr:uncharacterized protein LOC123448618 isoform X2 [Hordeum vulgare subsp. vulgare]